jgi:AcrR family transcriptional regulator
VKANNGEEHRLALLRATEARALRHGFQRLTMHEVAAKAGVSRRTLYRIFPTRNALLAGLFELRVHASTVLKFRRLAGERDFVGALRAGTMLTLQTVRSDKVLMEMAYGSGAPWFHAQMLDRRSELFTVIMKVQMGLWGAVLDAARRDGIINPVPTNRQILEWYTLSQYMTVMAQTVSRAEQEFTLVNFLIPSLLSSDRQARETAGG